MADRLSLIDRRKLLASVVRHTKKGQDLRIDARDVGDEIVKDNQHSLPLRDHRKRSFDLLSEAGDVAIAGETDLLPVESGNALPLSSLFFKPPRLLEARLILLQHFAALFVERDAQIDRIAHHDDETRRGVEAQNVRDRSLRVQVPHRPLADREIVLPGAMPETQPQIFLRIGGMKADPGQIGAEKLSLLRPRESKARMPGEIGAQRRGAAARRADNEKVRLDLAARQRIHCYLIGWRQIH